MPLAAVILLASVYLQADAYLQTARAAEQAGNFAEAERAYLQAISAQPNAETWQRLGLVRHMQNKFAEAIPAFQEAVRGNPKLWGAHLFLGIDFYKINQFSSALASLESAAALTQHNEIDFWLGATRLAMKQYLTGLQILERLHQRDPKNPETLRLLAQNYAEYSAALWNSVAEKSPDAPAGLEVHGRALEFEGASQAALEAYQQALELDPNRPGVHAAIGRLMLTEGKAESALAEFQRELKLRPGEPEASYQAAVALVRLKRPAEAKGFLERAAQWQSFTEDAKQLLETISAGTP
jgi:tetratricopeptide (TPR) repeat protein